MQVVSSKAAYEILRGKVYGSPSLGKQLWVCAHALAIDVVIDRLTSGLHEVIRQLSLLPHEQFPALIDESQLEASDALRARFLAEQDAGLRIHKEKPWLFGKGAAIPPAERKRLAEEALEAKRAAAYEAAMEEERRRLAASELQAAAE